VKISNLIKASMTLIVCFNAESREINTFDLLSKIDKNNFINYQITSFSFSPSDLIIIPNDDKTSFKDVTTKLLISTDIPKNDASINLRLSLTDNDTTCVDDNGANISLHQPFVNMYIDDQHLAINTYLSVTFNTTSDDGSKGGEYQVKLSFGNIPNGANNCSGSLSMSSELSL